MCRPITKFLGSLVLVTSLLSLNETNPDSNLVKADFGLSLVIGITSAVAGKYIYDRYFKVPANQGAARTSRDQRDRQCSFAFSTYDPGTGLYMDKSGKKRVCPYLMN
jgi:hypothetical protein